jgi:uroporphyrinogen decarboxylase
MEPLLVRAARRKPVERTPVWFMRQAGRSLPEYREVRRGRTLFDVVRDPELCAEVTLQPVRRHDVDAAVMFADIMLPVLGMGVDVELVENVGPVVRQPIASAADVERLQVGEPDSAILEAIAIVRRELRDDQAVIGFCGGVFTVAGYLVEGKPSRDFTKVKTLMYREPKVWHALCDKLAKTFATYVRAKADAGADVVQLFDSWVGALSVADYGEFVAPYSARILSAPDVPTIHFGTGTAHLLGAMSDAGGDVIGSTGVCRSTRVGRSSARSAASRETSTPRSSLAHGSGSMRARATCSTARGDAPGTSSTSATACCPRQILRFCLV